MIKPHGSDTLNPLYVPDDTERAALTKEAENLPAILISSGRCCISGDARFRLL